MKQLIRKLTLAILQDYSINWIYATDRPSALPLAAGEDLRGVDAEIDQAIARSPTSAVANASDYTSEGLEGLALSRDGVLLAVAHFVRSEQYEHGRTWPLLASEVALINIATEEAARGQGVAPRMLAAASRHFITSGTKRMIAFIWWTNAPSVRAFTKAGWQRIGFSVEVKFRTRWHKLHIRL